MPDMLAVLARVLMRSIPGFPVWLAVWYATSNPGLVSALCLAGSAVGFACTFAVANCWERWDRERREAYRPSVREVLDLWRDYERHVAGKR